MKQLDLLSVSPFETEKLGCLLGSLLKPGMLVALYGELGGGKTCFTRGIAAGIAPDSSNKVASPTFAIMNEYQGPIPFYHFDFYRLHNENEIIELGFEDYFYGNGICIVEWAERLGTLLPQERLDVRFEHNGDDRRTITYSACGSTFEGILERFAETRGSEKNL